jgi:hypothetical protein
MMTAIPEPPTNGFSRWRTLLLRSVLEHAVGTISWIIILAALTFFATSYAIPALRSVLGTSWERVVDNAPFRIECEYRVQPVDPGNFHLFTVHEPMVIYPSLVTGSHLFFLDASVGKEGGNAFINSDHKERVEGRNYDRVNVQMRCSG